MNQEPKLANPAAAGSKARVAITYLVVSLMLACFCALLAETGRLIFPGLNAAAIVLSGFALAWESILSYRRTHSGEPFGPNLILYHLAEWVILLALIKGALYLFGNPQDFTRDLHLWQTNFILTFFTGETLLAIGFTGLIWGLAHLFAAPLMTMESDQVALDLEKSGTLRNDREELKRGLIRMIFGVGGAMLVMTAVVSTSVLRIGRAPAAPGWMTAVLLAYFCLGFLLLAHSQYQILEARWFIQDVPAAAGVSKLWIPTCLGLLLAIALIASLLPTGYSIGLLALLHQVVSFLIVLPVTLELICIAPFLALLAALLRALGLLNTGEVTSPPASTPVFPHAPPAAVSAPIPWLELLKSAAFWIVFILVIGLALRYYITQNRAALQTLKTNPFSLWLGNGLNRLRGWLLARGRGIGHEAGQWIARGVTRIKDRLRAARPLETPFLAISARLPPRQRILLLYLAMIAWNERSGIRRKKTDTPYEYASYLSGLLPDRIEAIGAFTCVFMEARYTRHTLAASQADEAQAAWEKIQEAVREWMRPQDQAGVQG